jgi:hypothetical protein
MPRAALVLWVVGGVLGCALVLAWLSRTPSNDRVWAPDQERLPRIVIGDTVVIEGLRDFRYAGSGITEARYIEERYSLDDLERVWFALAPFARRYRGLAHSFLSFEFRDGRTVAVSVEARREAHERYSLVGGLFRAFEITYVVGSEEDLLGVRALRGDTLYLYPSVATPVQAQALFVDMLERARATQAAPEFYQTLFNNCNTNLRDHVNRATGARLPWGWGILLPGFSDALALREGVLDTALPLEEARARFRVDENVRRVLAEGGGDFSRRIRATAGEGPGPDPAVRSR